MKKQPHLIPQRISIVGWIEHFDLRTLRREACTLAHAEGLRVGQALLVSGARYAGARRFQFIVQTTVGPMVLLPQTGDRDLMLGLMLRVAMAAHDMFGE